MKKTIVELERHISLMRMYYNESPNNALDKGELLQFLCELTEYIKDNEK